MRSVLLRLSLAIGIAGGVIRVVHWWRNQSLWLDEAMIAVNVRDVGFVGLLGNLRFSQSAPLGWLFGERILLKLFGSDERVLRLMPLLFSLATIVIAYLIGRRWLSEAGLLVLVTLTAVAPTLVRYASELKQYSSDAFWVLAMVGLAGWALDRMAVDRRATLRALVIWWGVAIVASWLSMAAILVAPGLALVLVIQTWRKHDWRTALIAAGLGLVWLASFAAHYMLALRYTTSTPYLTGYWRELGGMPRSNAVSDVVVWLGRLPGNLAEDPLKFSGLVPAVAFWLLVFLGVAVAMRYRAPHGWLLVTPMLTGVILAMAQMVPLTVRLALWLAPVLFLAAAIGVDAAVKSKSWQAMALAGVLVLGIGPALIQQGLVVVGGPYSPDQTDDRAAVEWLKQRHRPGDLTLVTVSSYPPVAWYDPQGELRPGWYVRGVLPDAANCQPEREAREIAGYQRLIVYSGIQVDTHNMIEAKLMELGRIVEKQTFDLSWVWVVELHPAPVTDPPAPQAPNHCLAFSEL